MVEHPGINWRYTDTTFCSVYVNVRVCTRVRCSLYRGTYIGIHIGVVIDYRSLIRVIDQSVTCKVL